jgi:hypothetical protein
MSLVMKILIIVIIMIHSDDDNPLPSELVKNPNAMIKCLMRQVGARDELLEQ